MRFWCCLPSARQTVGREASRNLQGTVAKFFFKFANHCYRVSPTNAITVSIAFPQRMLSPANMM